MIDGANTLRPGSREALRVFFDAAIPAPIRPYSQWLQEELIVPTGPYRGQRLSFQNQPWVRLYAEQVDSRKFKNHVTTGPVQSGKSLVCYVGPIVYHIAEVCEKVLCGIPDLNMVETKWKEDIKPAIEAGRYASLIKTTGKGSKGGTANIVSFKNGTVLQFMSGGGNDKQRAGATTRILCITETDGMDGVGATSKEGTKIDQLLGRIRAYGDNAIVFAECSVTSTSGWIWQEYQAGTASRIMCPCPHCDGWISPERDDFIGWQDATNEIEAGERAAFFCSLCGGKISEDDRRAMNELALLIHRGQRIENSQVVGEMAPTETLGFRWSAFNNLFATCRQLGREEWKAAQKEDQETTQKTRKQQVWCIPIEGEEVERIELNRGIVRGSANGYSGRCNGIPRGEWPAGTRYKVAVIDVSKRVLQWALAARLPDQVAVIDYGHHETDRPDVIGEEIAIIQAIDQLTKELAAQGIDVGLIDCSNWTDAIHTAVAEIGPPWLCSHGMPRYVHPETDKGHQFANPHSAHWHISEPKTGIFVVNMEPDYWKSHVHDTYMIRPMGDKGQPNRGIITLFGEDPREHDEFATQTLAEQKVRTFKVGTGWKETWLKKSKQNHALDLSYMAFVAFELAEAAAQERAAATEVKRTAQEKPGKPQQKQQQPPPPVERTGRRAVREVRSGWGRRRG